MNNIRLIDANALMEYCSNQKTKTISNNDIARFPTEVATMNNIILPRNITIDFPLRHCEECVLCEPTLDDLYIRFDGIDNYKLTCVHAKACKELYLLGRSEVSNEILCGK